MVLQKSGGHDVDVAAGLPNPGDVDRRVADRIGQQQCDGGGHHDTTPSAAAVFTDGLRSLRLPRAPRPQQHPAHVGRVDQLRLSPLPDAGDGIRIRLDDLASRACLPFKDCGASPPRAICKNS
jgi:hypothetical protein